ncbi:MAG: hypothetical protein K8W52_10785 [Deltaproteobacteria bacterium]|nr:hypothetical protein [Deltaproteobacteria bacterium]
MVRAALASIALGLTGAACSTDTFSGDAFPIHVDVSAGPLMVHLRPSGGIGAGEALPATLDVLAPFTLIDSGDPRTITREDITVTLLGLRAPGSTDLVARAQFDVGAVALHPCGASDDPTPVPPCTVGDPAAPTAISAVLGADALAGDAVRLALASSNVYVVPDIAGDDASRTRECDAVFPSPFRGGGTLSLGGTEVSFPGRRIAIGACLGAAPAAVNPLDRGTNALLVLSTGLGPTLLSASAYKRYCQVAAHGCDPDPSGLPRATALLPSGAITGGAAQLPALALVATPTSNARGPCQDLYASHALVADCVTTGPLCPTSGGVCGAPAAVELSTPIDIIVVDDADPTLQALRAELRPDQAEVDGIVGTRALAALELDIDYPHGRMLARCVDGSCALRPRLVTCNYLPDVKACLP